jgi:hypothetical protein
LSAAPFWAELVTFVLSGHDPEKPAPDAIRAVEPVSRLREARFGKQSKARKDQAPPWSALRMRRRNGAFRDASPGNSTQKKKPRRGNAGARTR